jgi:hypothetical protein
MLKNFLLAVTLLCIPAMQALADTDPECEYGLEGNPVFVVAVDPGSPATGELHFCTPHDTVGGNAVPEDGISKCEVVFSNGARAAVMLPKPGKHVYVTVPTTFEGDQNVSFTCYDKQNKGGASLAAIARFPLGALGPVGIPR